MSHIIHMSALRLMEVLLNYHYEKLSQRPLVHAHVESCKSQ